MFCTKCGSPMPAAAHFCPGCGAVVTAETTGETTTAAVQSKSSRLPKPVLFVIVALIVAGVVAAVVMRRSPSPDSAAIPGAPAVSPAASATVPAGTASPSVPAAPDFDWSGLTHEQLIQARNALDAAIAREEHATSGATAHAPAP